MAISSSTVETEIQLLDLRLRRREDLEELEEAIREAELGEHEGKLAEVLRQPLKEAREYFDAERLKHFQVITNTHSNDVYEAYLAVDFLEKANHKTIKDEINDKWVPRTKLLAEARLNWQSVSDSTLNDLIKFKAKHKRRPDLVKDHLNTLSARTDSNGQEIDIGECFAPITKPKWENLLKEIDDDETKYRTAKTQVDSGNKEASEFLKYRYYWQAQSSFPLLEGISKKLDDALIPARMEINELIAQDLAGAAADSKLMLDDGSSFSRAYDLLTNASSRLDEWLKISNEELIELRAQIETNTKLVEDLEAEYGFCKGRLDEIDGSLTGRLDSEALDGKEGETKTIEERINKVQTLSLHFRNRLEILHGRLNSKRSLQEAKASAKGARGSWNLIKTTLEGFKDKDEEAKALYEEANNELLISGLVAELKDDNIQKATECMAGLPEDIRATRVSEQIRIIEDANAHEMMFRKYYRTAEGFAGSRIISEQCTAYAIYARLGDIAIPSNALPESMPEFSLNPFTFDARKKHSTIKEGLSRALDPLVSEYDNRDKIGHPYAPRTIAENWATTVQALREVGLLQNDERQRAAACWVEVGLARLRTPDVAIWEELVRAYDGLQLPLQGLLEARAMEIRTQAERISDANERISFLRDEQIKHPEFVGNVGLLICMALAYENLLDYESALKRVKISLDNRTDEERQLLQEERKRLEKEMDVFITCELATKLDRQAEADPTNQQRLRREAIDKLRKPRENARGDPRISELAETIYEKARDQLGTNTIRNVLSLNTPEGNVTGLLALIEFELLTRSCEGIIELEPDINIPNPEETIRELLESTVLIGDQTFSDSVVGALINLSKKVDPRETEFEWEDIAAADLLKIVEDRLEKINHVRVYLKTESLKIPSRRLGQVLEELRRLVLKPNKFLYRRPWQDAVLAPIIGVADERNEVQDSEEWKEAVENNRFTKLDKIQENILEEKTSLGLLARTFEGRRFINKLEDTKIITNCLLQIINACKEFHAREHFGAVVNLIEWSASPIPWMNPVQYYFQEAVKNIAWNAIPVAGSQGLLEWLRKKGTEDEYDLPSNLNVRFVSPEEYMRIRLWLGDGFKVNYAFGGELWTLNGWNEIGKAAADRNHNLELWNDFSSNAEKEGELAWNAYLIAKVWSDEKIPWQIREMNDIKYNWDVQYQKARDSGCLLPNAEHWLNAAVKSAVSLNVPFTVINLQGLLFEADYSDDNSLPRSYQNWMWGHAHGRLENFLIFVQSGPLGTNNKLELERIEIALDRSAFDMFPVMSQRALEEKEKLVSIHNRYVLASEDSKANIQLNMQFGPFPSEEELSRTRKRNPTEFRQLMRKARNYGPNKIPLDGQNHPKMVDDQPRRYWIYKGILIKLDTTRSVWETLFDWLGL